MWGEVKNRWNPACYAAGVTALVIIVRSALWREPRSGGGLGVIPPSGAKRANYSPGLKYTSLTKRRPFSPRLSWMMT